MRRLITPLIALAFAFSLLFGLAKDVGATTPVPSTEQEAVLQFFQYLHYLQSIQYQWEGLVIAGDRSGNTNGHVIYGGTPIQAFLYSLVVPDDTFVLTSPYQGDTGCGSCGT
jgi:hypothetical protein